MNGVVIWILALLLGCAAACLVVLCVRFVIPMKKLSALIKRMDSLEEGELRLEANEIAGAPGEIARAFLDNNKDNELRQTDDNEGNTVSEDTYKQRVVNDICLSLLPQPMRNNNASIVFALTGGILNGIRRSCSFYDYFFLDSNTFCVAVGEVPGNGIAEALFSVVTQTTIRSRLRMGRSLTETMSDVNNQLYDLGGKFSAHVLVCVLNTVNGRLSFVNAGGAAPLLMRSEERYEWVTTPVYAPLGGNESVTYRSEVMRLSQGDRLFLYTSDLGEMKNGEGEKFCARAMQSVLNRSRSLTQSTEEQLRFVQDEASAFCESGNDVLTSAAIALEYKKGNREFIFTIVRGTPEEAPAVTEFIRKALEDGGISQKDSARQILLADEMFALCCRSCEKDADIKVECAIQAEENVLHLRMFAPMGGQDPLNSIKSSAGGNAASYIRAHSRRAAFESGIERDMLEILSDISQKSGS